MHTIVDKKLLMLKPEEIRISARQPRKHFDEYSLRLLADSIAASGILQPIAVRRTCMGDYELIAGERRLRAAKMAGLRRIPCILHRTDSETAALYSILENLQRADLTIFEEAEAINRLIEEYGISQAEAAARLGIAQSTLSNKLRLLHLNEILRERIVATGLTERHARALLRLPDERRMEVLDHVIAHSLTLRQMEDYIFNLLNPPYEKEDSLPIQEEPTRKFSIGDIRLFSNSLSKLLETLQNAGIDASSRKVENEKYIEYKIRIQKDSLQGGHCRQLKIC